MTEPITIQINESFDGGSIEVPDGLWAILKRFPDHEIVLTNPRPEVAIRILGRDAVPTSIEDVPA